MDDDITVLLHDLEDRAQDFLPGDYHTAIRREAAAAEALTASLTGEQRALFLAFEESRNASAAAYQEALARQAFLLAREIFR